MELDTIVIGSGAGGLSAGLCLSRAGQRVVVLEKHSLPGGWCHSFHIDKYRFTPGVHYIGLLEKGGSSSLLYEGLGIADDLVFFRMNPEAYEHCQIGDERIDMPADYKELFESLAVRFPDERKGLAKYMKTVRDVSRQLQLIPKMNGFWDNVTIPWRTRHFGKYALFSLKTVIDWHIKDPMLKMVLNMQCGDHGLPPSKASFPLHCAVMDHYSQGGFYPMGGGGAIVKAMTKALKKHGGELRVGSGVKRILMEGEKKKRAIGVELENGEQLFAKRIVSNADPENTYKKLIGVESLSTKLVKHLNRTKYSLTSLILFLVVDMDVREAGFDSGNIWLMPANRDLDDLFEEMQAIDIAKGDEFPGMFISCTTLKDPASFDGRYHTLEAVTYINHESFSKFKGDDYKQSEEYLKFKEVLSKKIIHRLEKVLPGVSDKIVHQELGTPLTNEYFINSTNGCVYGTEKSLKQIGPFAHKAESEIENLYLCGASILSHGVAGASYSGVNTAAMILNSTENELLKTDGKQNIRIYEAEDSSDYPDWLVQKIELKQRKLDAV